jgi:hypothetical protein
MSGILQMNPPNSLGHGGASQGRLICDPSAQGKKILSIMYVVSRAGLFIWQPLP